MACCCGSSSPTKLLCACSAGANLVIDGCPVACGQKVFENLGIPFRHFVTTDYGVEKGGTDITAQLIDETAEALAREVAGVCDCAAG